ncbi:uncharacterized protein LOC126839522 [Adelges cooleyi]|uniref:uncharacterized protein LOC126839522 n=1 Tax=Adelges cooleyi TaxID=133065 RepID=UPI0021808B9D|nr:uncharacterized protein LOC126839522 [Adelges cooleyi]
MKLRLAFFLIISSYTLTHRVACHDGVYKLAETNSKVDVKSIVPERFMQSVDAYVRREGHQPVRGTKINPKRNPGLFKLIVSKVLDETMRVLDKFTVLVVAMVERNKTRPSLEFVLDYIELRISKLSGCLEFLFDNGANVTDALTGYIFYSGFKYHLFKTYNGGYYTYQNITEMMLVRMDQQQWLMYLQRVPTVETYQDLYTDVEESLEDIYKVYRQTVGNSTEWLSPQSLKWTKLLESNTSFANLFKELPVEDNESVYDQYLQIAREFDSVKVMDFYVNIGIALNGIIMETATDMMKAFFNLILRLIADFSNRDNSFRQISLAIECVENFLKSVHYFHNWMSYSKRLKSSETLESTPEVQVLQEYVNYCKTYNSINFPNTVAEFLQVFKTIYGKHFPGIELDTARITTKLMQGSITQMNIIDNMVMHMEVMTKLLEETSGRFR